MKDLSILFIFQFGIVFMDGRLFIFAGLNIFAAADSLGRWSYFVGGIKGVNRLGGIFELGGGDFSTALAVFITHIFIRDWLSLTSLPCLTHWGYFWC